MDTRIALSGVNPDVYGALMRGYQGAALREQDQQAQQDRREFRGALSQRYANDPTAGVLARTPEGQSMLQQEQKQREFAYTQNKDAAPVMYSIAEQFSKIPEAERAAAAQHVFKVMGQSNPVVAQAMQEQFTDLSDAGINGVMAGYQAFAPQSKASKNPLFVENPDGTIGVAQLTDSGQPVFPDFGDRKVLPSNLMQVDQGNQRTLVDPKTGQVVGVMPVAPPPEAMPEFKAGVVTAEGGARAETPQGRLEMQAAERAEAEATLAQQQNSIDRLDIISAAQDLRVDPALKKVYGTVVGAAPSLSQDVVDTEAKVTRVIDLLTLANLGKMSGVLSETDIKILANAGSILKNRRISPSLAEQELSRVEKVMSKYEALMNPGATDGVPDGVDPDLWNFMTPEERSLWK